MIIELSFEACVVFRDFGGSRKGSKMGAKMTPKSSKIEALGATGADLCGFGRLLVYVDV